MADINSILAPSGQRKKLTNCFVCAHCGVPSHRNLGGASAKKGYTNKYCAMSCRVAAGARINAERDFLARLAREAKQPSQKSAIPSLRALAAAIRKIASFKSKAENPCRVCGNPVGYSLGRPRIYCSTECSRQTAEFKDARRASKAKRKALKRGANGGQHIDPLKVFAAAGWKCQICNKQTPQRLRGTHHKRAPELDHVVAVSNGGAHTWANVQCACRECNLWKSNKIVIGQAVLFGV